MEKISASQAAKLLGISITDLGILERQGLIHSIYNTEGVSFYSSEEIARIKSRRGLTLSEEAAQVGIGIQREIASSVTFTRKLLMLAGGALAGYTLLVAVFTVLFIVNPLQTAKFLGIVKTKTNVSLTPENHDPRVLGITTSVIPERNSPIQTVLRPIGKVSLGLVRNISPNSYAQVSKAAILDPNDVLGLDTSGAITPERPINLPDSSLLQVGNSGLVANLNSQYLQGKQPGGNIGDIAVVRDSPSSTDTLADITARGAVAPVALTLLNSDNNITAGTLTATGGTINGVSIGAKTPGLGTFSTINGLTVTNNGNNALSIAGGKTLTINNSFAIGGTDGTTFTLPAATDILVGRNSTDPLTNKIMDATLNTLSGLTVSNFRSANISQWINDSGYITSSSTNTFTNKTIAAGSNTISGLTNSNLSGTASIANANLANSAITFNTSSPISGGATVSLGDSLTVSCPTCLTTGGNLFTLSATSGSNSSISQGGALTVAAGSNITTTNNGTGTVTLATSSNPSFTTINSLTIINNGANTLAIAAGKTLSVNNTVTFGGTDATTFTLPTINDTLVGRNSTDTLTNKTLSAPAINGAVTTSGLTFPAFSASGNITGSGTPSLASFGSINGLTFTTNATGFSIAGGTTSKTLTTNNSLTLAGVDGTSINFQGSDTYVGRATTDTLTNKNISAGSNTISGLANANLSGSAGITNANLANSAVTVTAGSGLSGGGAVALGGTVTLTNTGVTSLTGTTNQVNVSSGTGAITLTLPQNIHTGATPTFAGLTLSGLTNCGTLATDAAGVVQCDGATGDTAIFTDTTPATIADNDTTELFNDATKPSITPNIATQTILVAVHARFTGGGGADTDAAVRIVRNNGSAASCSTSPQVGDTFSTFMTNATDIADAAGTFLDSPATTSQVFYTVCSSANSNLGSVPVSNRVDVTLVELGADLAENYYTKDDSIGAGDVVVIDSSLPAGVRKSSTQYDNQMIGVISTNPGKVLDDAVGLNFGRAVPVALSGRVPVKVSTENGSIKPGDSLTSSSIPGVAMKATKMGSTIGMALSEFSGTDVGSVLIFIKSGAPVISPQDTPVHDGGALSKKIAEAITNVFKNIVEFFGNVTFHAGVTFLGRPTFNADTAGHAFIKAGNNEVGVVFEKEYVQNPVVTASVNLMDGAAIDEVPPYAIYDVSTKGFKIKLSKVTTFDLHFSWVALFVPDNNKPDRSVLNTPIVSTTPSPSQETQETSETQTPTVLPSTTPLPTGQAGSPSQEIVPRGAATESASPSPSTP